MPVIRQSVHAPVLTGERRKALVEQLARELKNEAIAQRPVIFEIPLEGTERIDILVVWEEWKDVPSEARSKVILDAYQISEKEKIGRISQALGVTYQEAIDQHVLPYGVEPMSRAGEIDPNDLRKAMLEHGGIPIDGNKIVLRFPTLSMAEDAFRMLHDTHPKGYWSLVQSVNPIY